MSISQLGAINTTALSVPGLFIQIVPPQTVLNGVPTNILGIVGTATWGPVNSPVIASGITDGTRQLGNMQARKFDLMTAVYAAQLQGAANFRLVRVTDGTDTAASTTITAANATLATALALAINSGTSSLRGPSQLVVATASSTTLTLTAKYTGTLGNSLQATIGAGTAAGTSKLSIALPGQQPETYDNVGVTASSSSTATFSGGTDGATTITSAVLVGQDTLPRKGMYALRGTGTTVAMLADADDTAQWTYQAAFGLSEGVYMIGTSPAGDTISNITSTIATAGIDSYSMKIMFGDWVQIYDNVNSLTRLISPQGFEAGKLSALSPQNSSLNKPMAGIVGTQKTLLSQQYSQADLQAITAARVDLIANPCPGGSYYGAQFGRNTSSNAAINGDNYTRLTNYIAATLNAGMGIYIGQLQTPDVQKAARATLNGFLQNLYQQNMIGNSNGTTPYFVLLDSTNNPQTRVSAGYMQADIQVTYLSVISYFLVNLMGGQTVTVTLQSSTPTS